MEDLYRAAWLGDANKLEELLQQNPTILADIPDDGRQTPLHISSLLGHLSFMEVLLNRNPDLAVRKDSSGRTALHLASTEGHMDIVKALLQANNEPSLKGDEEGRIPLLHVVMRGRKEVVQKLIMANPYSLSFGDGEGSSVFHLCVIHNQFETLQTLLKLDYATANITGGGQPPRPPIFTIGDEDGNTILHLAIMLKRVEVVSYLLSFPEIRKIATRKNKKGLTAHNILIGKTQEDFKICEIKHMLTTAQLLLAPLEPIDVVLAQNDGRNITSFKLVDNVLRRAFKRIEYFLRSEDEVWLEEMRGNLSLVTTVIATIAFQALISPPGGLIQQGLASNQDNNNTTSSNNNVTSLSSSYDLLSCAMLHDNKTYCPGQAIASYSDYNNDNFSEYLFNVTVSFLSSVGVSLLLATGILPLKNRIVIWILSIVMWIALTCLVKAFFNASSIITPNHLLEDDDFHYTIAEGWLLGWAVMFNVILGLISLRFSIWAIKIFNDMILNHSRSWGRHGRLLHKIFMVVVCFLFLSIPVSIVIPIPTIPMPVILQA